MSILSIINELKADNSRLAKEAILEKQKDNQLLIHILVAVYHPMIQYNIRKIPEYFPIEKSMDANDLFWALGELQSLAQRIVTGNAGIEHLRKILSSLTSDDAKVVELIIAKNLDCGVQISTINKIWPGMIPEFPVMLASANNDKLIKKVNFPACAQLKSDGMRCIAKCNDNGGSLFSRNGKSLDVLGQLDGVLSAFAGYVLDGELMVWDEDYYQFMSRKEGNGILTKAQRGTISEDEAKRICYIVWDMIPSHEYVSGGCYKVPYSERLQKLNDIIDLTHIISTKMQVIRTDVVYNLEEAHVIFQEYLDQGLEGIILKTFDGYWEDKRSKNLIKFKAERDADLLCIGVEEGKGKYAGMIGALICESADGPNGKVYVSIGTGLTDEDRKKPPEYYINNIIACVYNEIISNSKGERSLFLPVYVEVRIDKDKADVL